jgi:hypothetical protein
MNSKRLHILLILSIIVALIGLVGGAYETNTLLSQQAEKLTALKAKSMALVEEQQILAKSKKDIKKYAELEKITRAIVPEDKNQAEAVGQIVKIAEDHDIKLASITFPASSLGTTKTGTSASATGLPATAPKINPKTTGLSQLTPVPAITGVYLLIISVTSDPIQTVPYDNFIAFLSDLEHNRRTAQVSNIAITPDPLNRNKLSFTISLNEYIKP